MSTPTLELVLGANRVLTYAGYVLLAGTIGFWALVWPSGVAVARLRRLVGVGAGLLTTATVAGPVVQILLGGQPIGDTIVSGSGASSLLRLATLAALVFFLPDLVRAELVGVRRVIALLAMITIAGTLVVASSAPAGSRSMITMIADVGHVLATAVWLGGLVAMTAVLIRGGAVPAVHRLIRRFSRVASVSVIALVLTGVVPALAVAGGPQQLMTSRYGQVLLIKVLVVAALLVLSYQARAQAARLAFRESYASGGTDTSRRAGGRGPAVVLGMELVIAMVILGMTSMLVASVPGV